MHCYSVLYSNESLENTFSISFLFRVMHEHQVIYQSSNCFGDFTLEISVLVILPYHWFEVGVAQLEEATNYSVSK